MALYGAEGIVLGARNWGEADKIVTVFTRGQGISRRGIRMPPAAQSARGRDADVRAR